VGHSGGATLAADIAALTPGLVQHAILVSCPCDVPRFRKHMAEDQHSPVWLLPVHARSPMDTLNTMSTGTHITAISGVDDTIALPAYAENYVAEARKRQIDAELVLIAGKGHEILLEPQVLQSVAQVVTETAGRSGEVR
jgi:predicted esterase